VEIAFIGLGRMGQAMAARLLAAGHDVLLYNRTAGKLGALLAQGAREADSIAQAAGSVGIVLSMLADDTALRAVTEGPAGLLAALPRGGIHIAMGTHDVGYIRSLAAAHAAAGQILLAAPVLGRPEAVTAGRLGVIVGGDPAAIERCLPLLEALGRRVFRAGDDPGSASTMKLANNFLLACAIEAMGEAFSLVRKGGVDAAAFHEVLTDGLFACPAYRTYGQIIAEQSWDEVGFTTTLALKDIELVLAAGRVSAVPMPSAALCRDRLRDAIAHGDAQRDWSAMALEQARASGLS
jgi:3-hydroxyisobutyrate dehydrogenase-like beta-hydroxyacid dehydrogenase